MPRVTRRLLALSVLGFVAAPLAAQRSKVITADEIAKAGATVATAYDAVQTLRPRWLQYRGEILQMRNTPDQAAQGAQLHVYMDEVDKGDAEYLRSIPATLVATLRWMSANEAGSRFGPSAGPAIVVTLKR